MIVVVLQLRDVLKPVIWVNQNGKGGTAPHAPP